MKNLTLSLIIRGIWKTPNHSSDRRLDDTHKIKKQILNEVKRNHPKFAAKVGGNPDIDIDAMGEYIVLRASRHSKFNGESIKTNVRADDYFVQFLVGDNCSMCDFRILINDINEIVNEDFEIIFLLSL